MIPCCDVCGTDEGVTLNNEGTIDQTWRCTDHPAAASFEAELTALINRHSLENQSNTPDFILARYVGMCLAAFNVATERRTRWYTPPTEPLMPATASSTPMESK